MEKVYITPSPLEGCLLHPLIFKTGYLTPSTLQNRTNNPPSGFGRWFATVMRFYLFLLLFIFAESLKNHSKS